MSAKRNAALAVVLAAGGLAYGLSGMHDPPGAEECELATVLRATDAGLALETVDVCGSGDGGTETGESFVREVPARDDPSYRAKKRARNGKAVGLHRNQPSGCACSSGTGCERLTTDIDGPAQWLAAPRGSVMQAGEWRGECLPIVSCYDVSEMPLGSNLAEACR